MREIDILDNFLDSREFRNYVNSLLVNKDHLKYNKDIKIDDERISDEYLLNDNDIYYKKEKCFVQTYLNTNITDKELYETKKDIIGNGHGLIITNYNVSKEIKVVAKDLGIDIWDRDILKKYIGDTK